MHSISCSIAFVAMCVGCLFVGLHIIVPHIGLNLASHQQRKALGAAWHDLCNRLGRFSHRFWMPTLLQAAADIITCKLLAESMLRMSMCGGVLV